MEKYQLTPAEIEELEEGGITPGEIFNAVQILYSFEDWMSGNPMRLMLGGWGIRVHYLDENECTTSKENGKLTLFILPEREWLKIQQCKENKLREFETAYFEALVEGFEIKENGSLEPILLAKNELEKVVNLIGNEFPKGMAGVVYSNMAAFSPPKIWLRYRNDCGDRGSVSYWYKKICVNGEDGVMYVSHPHIAQTANELNSLAPDDLHFVVSALALHRFKGYLIEKQVALTTTKATFIEQVLKQILFVVSATKRSTAKVIEARKRRVDEPTLKKWLIEERDKELDNPDLKNSDLVQRETMGTPEDAANALAEFVEFYLGIHLVDGNLISTADKIHWGDILSDARAILSGAADLPIKYEFKVQDPQLWLPFRTYYKAIMAETKAAAFSAYIEGGEDPRPLLPFFHNGDGLDLALKAAFETDLVNEGGMWIRMREKTKAVSVFWRAAVTAGLAKADAPVYKVGKAMSEQFSVPLGQNAIDKKREISGFGEDYKELYKALLKIMRP